jgi:hypothetical protein
MIENAWDLPPPAPYASNRQLWKLHCGLLHVDTLSPTSKGAAILVGCLSVIEQDVSVPSDLENVGARQSGHD